MMDSSNDQQKEGLSPVEITKDLSSAIKSSNVSMVVMMGLPASGKSTLANRLIFSSNWHLLLVSFDDFIPVSQQVENYKEIDEGESQNTPGSVSLRKKYLHCVETIVSFVKDFLSRDVDHKIDLASYLESLASTLGDEIVADNPFLSRVQSILENFAKSNAQKEDLKVVIVVDDNNYYHSMRSNLFQVAKRSEIGFCIIHCKLPLKTCIQRNSERPLSSQVPHQVIVEMGIKYEEPNPLQNLCDMYCVEVNTSEEINMELLVQVISTSFNNFPRNSEDKTAEIERQRRICSENEVHQADLVLRKWVGKKMNLSCFAQMPLGYSSKKMIIAELNTRKKKTLEKLRSGEFKVSFDVNQDVEFRSEVIQLFESIDVKSSS